MHRIRLFVSLLFVAFYGAAGTAGTIFVDDDAGSGGNGSSWVYALKYLQDAFDLAEAGDRIYVAEGVYYPNSSIFDPNGIGDRNSTFQLFSGLEVYGGFCGYGHADPNYRDPAVYRTILSGDLYGDDLGDFQNYDENSYHVITAVNVDNSCVLDGFIVTGGNSNWGSVSVADRSYGGGMYNYNSSPVVSNCVFIGNYGRFDAGMFNTAGSSPTIVNCSFLGNRAYENGGGMGNSFGSDSIIVNCVFSGNRADNRGGAMFNNGDSMPWIINCTIAFNEAGISGGGVYFSADSYTEIVNSILWGNSDTEGTVQSSQIRVSTGSGRVDYSCVQEWEGSIEGENNVELNPKFMDADGEDDIIGTLDDDLRLLKMSVCINRGDTSLVWLEVDRSSNDRVQGGAVDMGAYEYYNLPVLVSHWKLDEMSGDRAMDSAGVNDGLRIGNGRWRWYDGRINGAMELDGLGDYIDCGNEEAFEIEFQISVCAWFKVNRFDRSFQAIVTKGDSSFRLQRWDGSGTIEFACTGVDVPGTEWSNIHGNITVDDGQWHHAAGVYDGERMSLYIDGVLDVWSEASGVISTNDCPVLIGENAEQTRRYWNGMIDDVRIYNYALSEDEIVELSQAGRTWHVDVNFGDDMNDGLSRDTAKESIQEAINKSSDGDRVHVWPGDYYEGIDFIGKKILVRSAGDAASLINPTGYAVSFHSDEGPQSVLKNFVIHGSKYAVFATSGVKPTLENLTIADNVSGVRSYEGAAPNISNCIFWNNSKVDLFGCTAKTSWLKGKLDPMPVAWWTFDEEEGNIAYDHVGGNNGMINGAIRSEGISGGGLDFDGVDNYVFVEDSDDISVGRSNYTISAWIKPRTTEGYGTIVAKVESVENKEYMLSVDDAEYRLDVERNGNNGREVSPVSVGTEVWQHVVVTFDSSDLAVTFYHNGRKHISNSGDGPKISSLPDKLDNDLFIGMRGGQYESHGFNGLIDEVMVFDRILSDKEVLGVYHKGIGPMFADSAKGDYHLLSERGRYMEVDIFSADPNNPVERGGFWVLDDVSSPCLDAGSIEKGPGFERVPNGGRLNLGAFGGTAFGSMSDWPIRGDLDRDGVVGLNDFAILAEDWMYGLTWR